MFEFNGTFLVAMASFVVFIMIMNAIFYSPILNIIRKREDYINSNYDDAKSYENSARDFNEERNKKFSNAQENCRKEFKKEVEKAQNIANEKIANAKNSAKIKIQTKKEDLIKVENELKRNIEDNIVQDLANSIKTRILG